MPKSAHVLKLNSFCTILMFGLYFRSAALSFFSSIDFRAEINNLLVHGQKNHGISRLFNFLKQKWQMT